MDEIRIRGARQHNLKNVDVDIPRNKLVVITGPSGSGKSSLAFHTLYAEGQRRYVESLSAYARQFLEQLEKPDVDRIEGLNPAIAIDQKSGNGNPRSTIATATEIYDYLRVLYAAAGIPHDPFTGKMLQKLGPAEIVHSLSGRPERTKLILLATIPLSLAEEHECLLADLQRQGFVRVRVNGEIFEIDDTQRQWPDSLESLEVVVDRLVVREGVESRLADSIETCLRICGQEARCLTQDPDSDDWQEIQFSTSYRNAETGFELGALTPKHFSFNSLLGACPRCQGLGSRLAADVTLMIPDTAKSLEAGCVAPAKKSSWLRSQIHQLCELHHADEHAPFSSLSESFQSELTAGGVNFEGLHRFVERHYEEATNETQRRLFAKWMTSRDCDACQGKRLKPEILAIKLLHQNTSLGIHELCTLSIEEALLWLENVDLPIDKHDVCIGLVAAVTRRLNFLQDVGLGYLSLDRVNSTLSGGEAQRIRLATQIGASLSGVIYVLDEPSIGLHQEDNARLIRALHKLRDIGNTVVVVEHDEEMMRAADWLIDMGPLAGPAGGSILAVGTPEEIMQSADSPTGKWLCQQHSPPSAGFNPPNSKGEIIIRGAAEHNLQAIDVTIPLGKLVCVTGPSGSGKSTLVDDILRRALARHFNGANVVPGKHHSIEGFEHIQRFVLVDQKPLGKSPRSNPATYTGALDLIRDLFTKLPLSRQRGYTSSRFSFNLHGGRCDRCLGDGSIRVDMSFLSDIYVRCSACDGRRFNRETLEITYKGRNIADILAMNAEDAQKFFSSVPKLNSILKTLCDVGLGYIQLGQPANTLSGGEAQRIKLAAELAKSSTSNTLYLLDEPTTGLHFQDVDVLLKALKVLRDAGNSLLIIEHNMEVIRAADWIIDLGPGGGKHGGKLVAEGTPRQLAMHGHSPTAKYLR